MSEICFWFTQRNITMYMDDWLVEVENALKVFHYEILENKVIKKYRIEEIPEREEPRDLEAEVEELRQVIDMLLGGEDNE